MDPCRVDTRFRLMSVATLLNLDVSKGRPEDDEARVVDKIDALPGQLSRRGLSLVHTCARI